MLGNVERRLIQLLLQRFYDGDATKVPTVQYLSREPPLNDTASLPGSEIKFTEPSEGDNISRPFELGSKVPEHIQWLAALAGPNAGWLSAILRKMSVVQNRNYINNPIKRMFAPRAGQKAQVVFDINTMEPLSIKLQGATRAFGPTNSNFVAVHLSKDLSSKTIKATISEERRGESIPLELEYIYRPDQPFAPIDNRISTVREAGISVYSGAESSDLAKKPIKDRSAFPVPYSRRTATIPGVTDIVPTSGLPIVTDVLPQSVFPAAFSLPLAFLVSRTFCPPPVFLSSPTSCPPLLSLASPTSSPLVFPRLRSLAAFSPPLVSLVSPTSFPALVSLASPTLSPLVTGVPSVTLPDGVLPTSGLPGVTDVLPSVTIPGGVLPTTGLFGVTDILPGTSLPGVTDIIPTSVPSLTLPDGVLPTSDLSDSTLQQLANHIHEAPAYLSPLSILPWTCSATGFVAPASHSSSIFVP
ncbi:hypothetical protein CF319_g7260 [Tilletia indica]|nr:hypothetical protein CF319_g7260 [Tilletia indica]